jgi:hypothetical protein
MKIKFGPGTAGLAQRIGTKIESKRNLTILEKVDFGVCQINQFS